MEVEDDGFPGCEPDALVLVNTRVEEANLENLLPNSFVAVGIEEGSDDRVETRKEEGQDRFVVMPGLGPARLLLQSKIR